MYYILLNNIKFFMKKTIVNCNNINNHLIRELRKRTNISIVKCKEALIQSHGDIEVAIDNIRKFGLEIAASKSQRITTSGIVIAKVTVNKQRGVIIEINCETDFVARDSFFQEFANAVVTTALNENINNIDILNDFFEKKRIELIAKVKENVSIRRFSVLTGSCISCYTHVFKIGVIISISNNATEVEEFVKGIAMHIIAKNPRFIHVNDIPKDVILREYRIQKEISDNLGKSQDILERIITGRMNKFFNEVVLLQQNFVLDTNKTVGALLDINNIKICGFVRFELGDNSK